MKIQEQILEMFNLQENNKGKEKWINEIEDLVNVMKKELYKTKKHKHKWIWNKNYECSYCELCGIWDRD